MEVTLRRLNDAVHFEADNGEGLTVQLDGAAGSDYGGEGKGMRPMQMLLASVGGCSVFDVVAILKKQREDIQDVQVKVTGEREKGKTPSPFKSIHLHFILKGKLNPEKVKRAIELSVEKYCSVKESLDKNIKVSYDFEIV
ncbi:MAG: OsmC family protein [Flammeovirgaceae bacterium]